LDGERDRLTDPGTTLEEMGTGAIREGRQVFWVDRVLRKGRAAPALHFLTSLFTGLWVLLAVVQNK
jgi:hypothetical protein